MVSFGLESEDDRQLYNWVGCIIGNFNTQFAGRVYNLKLYCGDKYPQEPPTCRFVEKINLPCVDSRGNLDKSHLPYLRDWKPDHTIRGLLRAVADVMLHCPRLPQPTEGTKY